MPHENEAPAPMPLTTRLRNGVEVLAKRTKEGNVYAMTYANLSQAKKKAASLGDGWEVRCYGRPFFVCRVPPPECEWCGAVGPGVARSCCTGPLECPGCRELNAAEAAKLEAEEAAGPGDPVADQYGPQDHAQTKG